MAALNNRGNAKKHLRKTSAAIADYQSFENESNYVPALKNISSCFEIKKDYSKA